MAGFWNRHARRDLFIQRTTRTAEPLQLIGLGTLFAADIDGETFDAETLREQDSNPLRRGRTPATARYATHAKLGDLKINEKLAKLRAQWLRAFLHPPVMNEEKRIDTARAIRFLYMSNALQPPRVRWCDSPWAALDLIVKEQIFLNEPRVEGHPDYAVRSNVELAKRLRGRSPTKVLPADIALMGTIQSIVGTPPELALATTIQQHIMDELNDYVTELSKFGVEIPAGQIVGDSGLFDLNSAMRASLFAAVQSKGPPSFYFNALLGGLGISWAFPDVVYLTPMPEYHAETQQQSTMITEQMLAQGIPRGVAWPTPEGATIEETDDPFTGTRTIRSTVQRLHNDKGMAIRYPDGHGVWLIKGIRVDKQIVMHPETLNPPWIFGERNVEKRRIMLERFGFERLVQRMEPQDERTRKAVKEMRQAYAYSSTTVVDRRAFAFSNFDRFNKLWLRDESKFGKLWEIIFADDEPLRFVQVKNSTPERDGTFRSYFLRVHPSCLTAREAVAWTFDLSEEEYDPIRET